MHNVIFPSDFRSRAPFESPMQSSPTSPSQTRAKGPRLSLRLCLPRLFGRIAPLDLDAMSKRIRLPSAPVADEDMARLSIWEHGRTLARQEAWEHLSTLVQEADAARRTTPGGQSEALILAMGAHADVVGAARDALHDRRFPSPEGIEALRAIAEMHPQDHALSLLVALAHLRIVDAWRAKPEMQSAISDQSIAAHLAAAEALLAPFDPLALSSPALAAVCAEWARLSARDEDAVAETYRTLVSLDPGTPQHMRAFGVALAHDSRNLAHAAQYISDITASSWGAGAHVWLYLDAIPLSPEGLSNMDTTAFIAGMRDILARRPDQSIVNELAAFCTLTLRPGQDLRGRAETARRTLHACQDWILREHLQELHPALWVAERDTEIAPRSQAGKRAVVTQGRLRALQSIAQHFAPELADGSTIAFSPAGMYRLPAF